MDEQKYFSTRMLPLLTKACDWSGGESNGVFLRTVDCAGDRIDFNDPSDWGLMGHWNVNAHRKWAKGVIPHIEELLGWKACLDPLPIVRTQSGLETPVLLNVPGDEMKLLVDYTNPESALMQVSESVTEDELQGPSIEELSLAMISAIRATNGACIAANQIGSLKRLVIMSIPLERIRGPQRKL